MQGVGVDALLGVMDEQGVATGILTAGLDRGGPRPCSRSPTRTPDGSSCAAVLSDRLRPTRDVRRIRELAEHPRFSLLRVMPLATQVPINDARHYPAYQICEELGIPVGINVGVPGPRVRSRVQHPELLEDVMIDFPDLVIIGAHMGHPYEELLMNYMRKWPNLYLSCTAYAPQYFDPALVRFMNTKAFRGRVIWGATNRGSRDAASPRGRALPIDEEAMALFLGAARRLLDFGS